MRSESHVTHEHNSRSFERRRSLEICSSIFRQNLCYMRWKSTFLSASSSTSIQRRPSLKLNLILPLVLLLGLVLVFHELIVQIGKILVRVERAKCARVACTASASAFVGLRYNNRDTNAQPAAPNTHEDNCGPLVPAISLRLTSCLPPDYALRAVPNRILHCAEHSHLLVQLFGSRLFSFSFLVRSLVDLAPIATAWKNGGLDFDLA